MDRELSPRQRRLEPVKEHGHVGGQVGPAGVEDSLPEMVNNRREPAAVQPGVIEFAEAGQVWVLHAEPGYVGQLVKILGHHLTPVRRKPEPGPVLLAQIAHDVSGAALPGRRVPVPDGDGDIRPVDDGPASLEIGVLPGGTGRHGRYPGRLTEEALELRERMRAVEVGGVVGRGHGQDGFEPRAGPGQDAAGDDPVGAIGEGGNHDQTAAVAYRRPELADDPVERLVDSRAEGRRGGQLAVPGHRDPQVQGNTAVVGGRRAVARSLAGGQRHPLILTGQPIPAR